MPGYLKLEPTEGLWTGYQPPPSQPAPAPETPSQEPVPAPETPSQDSASQSPLDVVGWSVRLPPPPEPVPIRGPVTAAGYEGQIKLTGVHFGLSVPWNQEQLESYIPAGNPGALKYKFSGGSPTLDPIVVTKRMDRSSVALLEAATRVIPLTATISLTVKEQADETQYCTIQLERALVSQAESSWQDAAGLPVESWTFHYEQIGWAFQPSVEGEPVHRYSLDLRLAGWP
jgi:type VI secretion system Hcp family effector